MDEEKNKSEAESKAIREQEDIKSGALKRAKWPMKGVGIDNMGNVTYLDKPLDQAGGAERWLFAVSYAIVIQEKHAKKTKLSLKLLFIDEIGDLDNTKITILRKVLKQYNYQGIVTAVRSTGAGDCVIEMADGVIKKKVKKDEGTKKEKAVGKKA